MPGRATSSEMTLNFSPTKLAAKFNLRTQPLSPSLSPHLCSTSNGCQNPPRPLRQTQRPLLQHRRRASSVNFALPLPQISTSKALFSPQPCLPPNRPQKPLPSNTHPLPEPPATPNPSKSSAPTTRYRSRRRWARRANRSKTFDWTRRGRSTGWGSGRSRASRCGGC